MCELTWSFNSGASSALDRKPPVSLTITGLHRQKKDDDRLV
jgi:hypothetical protein